MPQEPVKTTTIKSSSNEKDVRIRVKNKEFDSGAYVLLVRNKFSGEALWHKSGTFDGDYTHSIDVPNTVLVDCALF